MRGAGRRGASGGLVTGLRAFGRTVYDVAMTALWAVALALLIRTFVLEPFRIPSTSMLPGLWVGDYLFVSKFSYGYSRYSFPYGASDSPWNPFRFGGRILAGAPQRGDVVVFRQPGHPDIDFIKRVVGLPGERIRIVDRVVHVNGRPLARTRLDDAETARRIRAALDQPGHGGERPEAYRETTPEGRSYVIWQLPSQAAALANNTPQYEVPPGHYFVMGDNRDDSTDSRSEANVGFIPAENLIGRAEFLFFSTDHRAELWQVGRWLDSTRLDRIFMGIR